MKLLRSPTGSALGRLPLHGGAELGLEELPPELEGGKNAVEEVGDGEKPRPWGKTNSKKDDKRDVASNALIATMEDMMAHAQLGDDCWGT